MLFHQGNTDAVLSLGHVINICIDGNFLALDDTIVRGEPRLLKRERNHCQPDLDLSSLLM